MADSQDYIWILFSAGDVVSYHKTQESAKSAYHEYVAKEIIQDFSPEDTYESNVRWVKLVLDTTYVESASLKSQDNASEVLRHLADLDGSPESVVSFLTGLTHEELESIGGFPQR